MYTRWCLRDKQTHKQTNTDKERCCQKLFQFNMSSFVRLLDTTQRQWGFYALRHGIQNSMAAILACHPALSTEWLDWMSKWCERWRIGTGISLLFLVTAEFRGFEILHPLRLLDRNVGEERGGFVCLCTPKQNYCLSISCGLGQHSSKNDNLNAKWKRKGQGREGRKKLEVKFFFQPGKEKLTLQVNRKCLVDREIIAINN